MHRSILTLAACAALTVPATAEAATAHFEGPEGAEVLVITAAPGERNSMSIQDHVVDGAVTLYDSGVTWVSQTPYCSVNYTSIVCPAPNGLRVDAGDGDDWVTVTSGVTEPVHLVGGTGDDRLEGEDGPDRIDGGDGQDRVSGSGGDDVLDGGAGGDVVDGYSGRDVVRGGDGDDTLHGDSYEQPSADVVDGGAGVDTIESDYSTRLTGDAEPLLHFTLAGGADDGRPGENDDVRNVERLMMSKGGTYIGSEGPDYVKLHQVGDDGVLDGRGGDDELRGGDGRDRIDGGHGGDRIDAGFGDDTITGGPGRDTISADLAGGDCGPFWCKVPHGNDTIQVRDGEADSVTCGAGTDAVVADASDTVAPDCEDVDRAAGPTPDQDPDPDPDPRPDPDDRPVAEGKATLTITTAARLKRALRNGLTVKLTGLAPGKQSVTARSGRKVVASRKVTVGPTGTATARLRFTRAARRSLGKRRQVTLVIRAGSLTRKVQLAR